jgi:ATP-binding cassette, subfamily C, bacterial CydC
MNEFDRFYQGLRHRFRTPLWIASVCAAGVSIAAAALLGLSGWFLSGAAVAGITGLGAVMAFNYLLPSAAIRALAIMRTVLRYFERLMGHTAALRALAVLRPWVFSRLMGANPKAALRVNQGQASARLVQDVSVLEGALISEGALASALGAIGAALLLNLFLSPLSSLISAIGLGVSVCFGLAFMKRQPSSKSVAELGDLKQSLFETLVFLPDISAFRLSETFMNRLEGHEKKLVTSHLRQGHYESLMHIVIPIMMALSLGVILICHIHASLPLLALSLLVTTSAFDSVAALLKIISQKQQFEEAKAHLREIVELETPKPRLGVDSFNLSGQRFGLNNQTRLLISGPSGSGKTRLIEALMGFRDDVPEVRDTLLAAQFSFCPQDAPVLTGTVADNLQLSEPLDEASMWEALETAQLKARFKALNVWLGDGGVRLSGGERKRLSLARALLRKAPILILDEPTEGLDMLTESALVQALRVHLLAHNQGLILISHKPLPHELCSQHLDMGFASQTGFN